MASSQAGKIASYVLLPGIVPRARALFTSGFGYTAYLMALVYGMVRLLPAGHPYLQSSNIGRFGIRHVIGEAANNLVFSRRNIDQWIIFIVLLTGLVLIGIQFALMIYAYGAAPASAMAQSIFNTPAPAKDIAFTLLDRVFGVPQLFCNTARVCTEVQQSLPWPMHTALHEMFRFYSMGMLLVGVLLFLYFVVVVIAETAVTGSPFGQRFQNIWVPLRLVMALGLLVPINYGLNSGQYIVLYAAKLGSGFASNSWVLFNNTITSRRDVFSNGGSNPTGERSTLVARPRPPDITPVVQFMSMAHACAAAYWMYGDPPISDPMAWMDDPDWNVDGLSREPVSNDRAPSGNFFIRPYLVKTPFPWMRNLEDRRVLQPASSGNQGYLAALDFYDNADIEIVFGHHDDAYTEYRGNVKPLCGSIRIKITDLRHKGEGPRLGGADMIQNFYFNLITTMWYGSGYGDSDIRDMAERFMAVGAPEKLDPCSVGAGNANLPGTTGSPPECETVRPGARARQALIAEYQSYFNAAIAQAWDLYNQNGMEQELGPRVIERGWAGAGIWYNAIADINGAFITAVAEVPTQVSYPLVMEQVRQEVSKNNAEVQPLTQFTPKTANNEKTDIAEGATGIKIASVLNDFFIYWNEDDSNQADNSKTITGNIFEDTMNIIFGMGGLFDMRGENAHIHPLAQLTALGKGLVDATLRNVAISSLAAALGGPMAAMDKWLGSTVEIAGSFLMSTAMIGLTAGLVLYYVLPFLPFLYFFFAVISWIKSVFEAMVGAPLWALAHLRLDGEGLPGDAASGGYFMIFEIFLRPILTVIALTAATVIFTAEVRVLHFIFGLAVDNVTGAASHGIGNVALAEKVAPRGVVDEFFFTVLYAIMVYMMATASFKLIDKIPDNTLRWMGAGVSTFNDINPEESISGIQRYTAISGATQFQSIASSVRDVSRGLGGTAGDLLKSFNTGTGPGT